MNKHYKLPDRNNVRSNKCFGKLWNFAELECQHCLMSRDCAIRSSRGAIYAEEEEVIGHTDEERI